MEHWLYEKLSDKPHDCIAIAPYNTSKEAIDVAKRMTEQWGQVSVSRHYKVMYHEYKEWENQMKATIKQETQHYYALTMGDRVIGGTNKQSLADFARKQGYTEIEFIPLPKKQSTVFNPFA